jgi:hypothetical protein
VSIGAIECQVTAIVRHAIDRGNLSTSQLRDISSALYHASNAIEAEIERIKAARADMSAGGLLAGLAEHVAKQQAIQTGEPA